MVQKKLIYISSLVAICLLATFTALIGLAWDQNILESSPELNTNQSQDQLTTKTGRVNNFNFVYEKALTNEQREKGLMFRTSLAKNAGMLFVFEQEDLRNFWMKNTYISLDIIFLDKNFKVVNLHTYTQPNQTNTIYPSIYPSMYVVEFNAGTSLENNIQIGDKFLFDEKL